MFGACQKIIRSSFRLIISFTTNCVTVGIKVLKLCFTSEFKISRGADLEHFRKVSQLITCCHSLTAMVMGNLVTL